MKLREAGVTKKRTLPPYSLIILALACLCPHAAAQTPVSLYDDARVKAWGQSYLAGKRSETLTAIEADLKSPAPHPSAAFIWTQIQESLGRLKETPPTVTDPQLQPAARAADIEFLYLKGAYKQLLAKYPPAQASDLKDFWALNRLAWAAQYQFRFAEAFVYAVATLRQRPDNFRAVWTVFDLYDSDEAVYPQYLALVKPDGEFGKTAAGRFLYPLLLNRVNTPLNNLAAVEEWLREYPGDARALVFKAHQLADLGRYEDAAKLYDTATQAFPFPLQFTEFQARQLIRLNRFAEARAVLQKYAPLKTKDAGAAQVRVEVELANSFVNTGERGEARKVLEETLKKYPDEELVRYYLASLELNDARPAQALEHARKAAELKPNDLANQIQLLETLQKSGKNQEAWTLFQATDQRFTQKSTNLFFRGTEILREMERFPEMAQLYERAVAEYPRSTQMNDNLAFALDKTGKATEALKVLRQHFAVNAPDSWSISKLRELVVKTAANEPAGQAQAEAELAALRRRYPHCQALWEDAEAQIDGGNALARKVALWRGAIAANPGRQWPYSKAQWVLLLSERWEEAEKLTQEELAATASSLPEDRANALYDRAIGIVEEAEKGSVSRERLAQGLRCFEEFRHSGAFPLSYYRWRTLLLEGLGRKQDAADSMQAAARLAPDNYSLLFDFVTKYAEQTGRGKAMSYFFRYVNRSPYDGQRLSNLLHLQVMWYVNAPAALQTVQRLKEIAPDYLNKDYEAQAWGRIGDAERDFTGRYSKAESLSVKVPSDRYIDWYADARRRAQNERAEVGIDDKDPLVYQVTHPDGLVVKRKNHPLSGKQMLIQVGAAKVECRYDEYGDNLLSIEDSAGNRIKLDYYPDGTIQTMTGSDGSEISFVYNENKKPIVIAAKGLGQINATYAPNGELEKAESTGGRKVALQITTSFNKLLEMTRRFEASGDVAQVPELPFTDEKLDALRAAYRAAGVNEPAAGSSFTPARRPGQRATRRGTADTSAGKLAENQAAVAVARYLTEHIADRRGYADEARALLQPVIANAQKQQSTPQLIAPGLESVGLWHQLLLATRKNGLSAQDFTAWSEMRDWVAALAKLPGPNQSAAQAIFQQIEAKPLALLKSAAWLPDSYLNSPGYWRRFNFSELLPENLRGKTQLNAVLVRQNNETVVGTDQGLLVLRRGFWEWFGFDEAKGKFSATLPASSLKASSNLLSLAETASGELFIGTANGLLRLPPAYEGAAQRFITAEDGLPVPRVDCLAAAGDELFIGTGKGLFAWHNGKITARPEFAGQAVNFLRAMPEAGPSAFAPVLIGTDRGVFGRADGKISQLAGKAASDAIFAPGADQVFLLRAGEIFTLDWDGATPGPETYLTTQNQVIKSSKIYGLAALPLEGDESCVAVLTDRGLSLYRDAHFEHRELPLADKSAAVFSLRTADRRSYLLTSEGVYALERGQTAGDLKPVTDLLTFDDWGLTFVARGVELAAVRHANATPGAVTFSDISATRLARDRQGRLLTNDGFAIMRFEKGSATPQTLFEAAPLVAAGWPGGRLTSILAASDGAIWVTAGASLFRWQDGVKQEFSLFDSASKFPSRTEMLSRVVETYDGRIWVIGSDERHLSYQGQKLEGGVLQWNGAGFERLDLPAKTESWFITGYTKIGDNAAVVGTTSGFALHRADRFTPFKELKDATYLHLKERQPMLWLGTRGAKLGADVWLFGTAGGVVAHQNGAWFYPDALNYKLPEDYRFGGNYGARTVHAIETDRAGHIYAGTDRGLLIYDSGGGDATAFLVSNHYERDFAFKLAEQKKLQAEADILLSGLPAASDLAQQVKQVRDAEREIAQLRAKLLPGVEFAPASRVVKTDDPRGVKPTGENFIAALGAAEQAQLAAALEAKEKAKNQLLATIQRENPGLSQMLELKPLDLVSLRKDLERNQAVLQYLPTERNLYIQIVTREGTEIVEVKVPQKELQQRALRAAAALQNGAGARKRDGGAEIDLPANTDAAARAQAALRADLAWLYDQLLRPAETHLDGRAQIFIVPVGNLNYLPFAALLRSVEPQTEYAVARYNFGYLPSMYLFDLVMRSKRSRATDTLIFGDPDGSLPGAREEAKTVQTLTASGLPAYLGEAATYETLKQKGGQAKVLHLATHGHFHQPNGADSWVLLAQGRKLSIFEAMMLPLEQTEMVVLSACETGLSAQGLEYATLTRAFAQAGAPTLVATLWQVNDDTSRQLMEKFYRHLPQTDRFTALAQAQREMLANTDAKAQDPSAWAGYIVFGKP